VQNENANAIIVHHHRRNHHNCHSPYDRRKFVAITVPAFITVVRRTLVITVLDITETNNKKMKTKRVRPYYI
jgi:hypothetical protein